MEVKMRSNAFAAYEALSSYGVDAQHQAFLEQNKIEKTIRKKEHTHGPRSLAQFFCRRRRQLLSVHDLDLEVKRSTRSSKVADSKVAERHDLSADIIANILSWLPVKSLTMTLSEGDTDTKMKEIMMMYTEGGTNKNKIEYCSFPDGGTNKNKIEYCSFPEEIENCDKNKFCADTYTLSNSVNGLICVRCWKESSSNYLMNLSTREVQKLPEHIQQTNMYTMFLGLGFDVSTGEYKVVRLLSSYHNELLSFHYKILTIGSNQEWRYIGEIQCKVYDRFCPKSSVFLNGKLHWLADNNEDEGFIFTIDMKDETHGIISPPVCLSSIITNEKSKVEIQEDEGRYLMLLKSYVHELRIWIMKDYTTHQWTNTYTIDLDVSLLPRRVLLNSNTFSYKGLSKLFLGIAYNKVLFSVTSTNLKMGEIICSFDLQTKTFQKHCLEIYSWMNNYFYSESLLSPRKLLCKDNIGNNNKKNMRE